MKRARATTRSEAARARALVAPVLHDALLALLDHADATVAHLLAGVATIASLTAYMVARMDDSVKLACGDVRAARAALVHSAKRVAYCARWRTRSLGKRVEACTEVSGVSAKQLRVCSSAFLRQWTGVDCVEGMFAGCVLVALCPHAQISTVADVCPAMGSHLSVLCRAGSVATGDGLRVVSAAGPGLKWFEPHSRNEFTVVLAQTDDSVPVWLTTGDVTATVRTTARDTPAGSVVATVTVESAAVSVSYGGVGVDVLEVVLCLAVCSVAPVDAAGDRNWCVIVPRKPLAGHECAAVGTHIRSLTVAKGHKSGIAVTVDEKWMVVGMEDEGTLCVYSLPGGELVRTFGGRGDGPLQFDGLGRLCFAPNGNLIVVERYNMRLQEVTLEGVFVRFIGVGAFDDNWFAVCVAVSDAVMAVGCEGGPGSRVVLFNVGTGLVTSRFGDFGSAPGELSACMGIRFTPDGSHLIVAEDDANRVSLFTATGVFVRCVGVGVLGGGDNMDVMQSVTGEFVVADRKNHRVCVFSPDGSELVRSWGVRGIGVGRYDIGFPSALAAAGQHLYVMGRGARVQVFN